MEGNLCGINHLDGDVLLPPRKRLLAGFIKQRSSDGNGQSSDGNGSAVSQDKVASPMRIDSHVNELMNSHSNISAEELLEVSKSAVARANKVARAARAAADRKAVTAAKAVAKAKSALELVASLNEEERFSVRKNKKKHVPVQLLYKKHQPVRSDEELARKLHQSINSSPRISKTHSRKKLKGERIAVPKGVLIVRGIAPKARNVAASSDSEDSDTVKSKYDIGEAESSRSKEKTWEEDSSSSSTALGRKRGRVKLKKLPLSICSFKDQVNPINIIRRNDNDDNNNNNNVPLFSLEPTRDGVQTRPVWKYKAPAAACVNQNKVMQS